MTGRVTRSLGLHLATRVGMIVRQQNSKVVRWNEPDAEAVARARIAQPLPTWRWAAGVGSVERVRPVSLMAPQVLGMG